jgi:hypothetical protein
MMLADAQRMAAFDRDCRRLGMQGDLGERGRQGERPV